MANLKPHLAISLSQSWYLCCGWANLRSLPAIPFNQNQNPVCGLIMTGDLPKIKDGLIMTGDLPKCKMVSLWWVTYPSGEKGRVVSFLWVTYPSKKKMENGLILMGDLPRNKMMVSLWWVTYPSGKRKEWSHCNGWLTQIKTWRISWIVMDDLPKK